MLRQSLVYTALTATASLLVAAASALLARGMTTSEFGSFAFCLSFLQLAGLLFEFGLFVPASREAARQRGSESRRLLGGAFVGFIPIAGLFALTVFGASFVVDDLFNVEAGSALGLSAPLAFVFPFAFVALQLAQGTGQLGAYAVALAGGHALFIVLLVAAGAPGADLEPTMALLLRVASLLAAGAFLAAWLRPVFAGATARARDLVRQARDWGFRVYVGRVLSTGTYQLDVLMLGALTDARQVGFYTLAAAIANAIFLPANGLAVSLFRRMAKQSRIDRAWIVWTAILGLVGTAAVSLLADPFIRLVFSARYIAAGDLVLPLALAAAVRGVTTIFNSFLAAQARGRELRNAAVVMSGGNVILNFALIPPFGAPGAAWASFVALLANLIVHALYYRRTVKDSEGTEQQPSASSDDPGPPSVSELSP